VAGLTIAAPAGTRYRAKAEADHDDGKPSAWLECFGRLALDGAGWHIEEVES
jgi:hypothetical protein